MRREAIGLITKQAGDTLPILDLLMSLHPPTDPNRPPPPAQPLRLFPPCMLERHDEQKREETEEKEEADIDNI